MESKQLKMDIYKSKRRLALFFYILSAVVMVGSIVLNAFAFSDISFVVQDRETNNLFNEISDKKATEFYTNTTFVNKEKSSAETFYRSVYTKNLSDDGYQHILSVSDRGSVLRTTTFFNGENLPFVTSVGNSLVYSNKENPPTFETLLINLFKYRERNKEISYDTSKFDGFVYLPDYYADYLIEHNSAFSTYEDLFDNENPFCLNVKGNTLKYKIANIFCVNGFKKEYCGDVEVNTPYEYGKKLNSFFNNFCIVSNTKAIVNLSKDLNHSVVSVLNAKRFMLMDTLNVIQNVSKVNDDSANVDLYYSDGENIYHYNNSAAFSRAYLYGDLTSNWPLKIVGIVIYLLSVGLISFTFFRYSSFKSFYIFTGSSIVGLTLSLIVFSILRKTPLLSVVAVYFNSIGIFVILMYLMSLLLLSSGIFIKKQGK